MEDNFYEQEIEIAQKVRDILNADPSVEGWINECTESIQETGSTPEDTFQKLSQYFVNDHKMRNIVTSVLEQDENGEQLLQLIFQPEETYIEGADEDEEEEEDDDNDFDIKEEVAKPDEKILTNETLKAKQKEQIQNVASTLNVSEDVAYFILSFYTWNDEKALVSFMNKPSNALTAYCITQKQLHNTLGLKCVGKGDCDVCCEEGVDLYALQCGHSFCKECWKEYILANVEKGNADIRCQAPKCKACILPRDVEKFCGGKISDDFQNFLLDSQIATNTHIKRCINPHCNNLLTIDSVGMCMVAVCKCGARMCWRCGEASHAPCSCENKAKWLDIADDDKVAAKWLSVNTKICPKCGTRIEKNGGCNHMTCYKCHHEFCWICGHEWATHGGSFYECNRYKPETGKGKNELKTDDVDRLSHYFARYTNHMKSLDIEKQTREKNQERLINNFTHRNKDAMSLEEAKELTDKIFQTIKYSRSILLWSYPHAYYMKTGSVELNLFEHVQKGVEMYLEELTDYVENGFKNPPRLFEASCRTLEKNVEVLLKHVDSG